MASDYKFKLGPTFDLAYRKQNHEMGCERNYNFKLDIF